MSNVYVTVEDIEDDKPHLVVEIAGYGERAIFRLPRNTSPDEIAQVLRHKVLFLPDDLPWNLPIDRRERIIKLHEEAVEVVPGLRRRI